MTFVDLGQKFLTKEGNLPRAMMPDLLHPEAKGYQVWADNVSPIIKKLMGIKNN